MQTLVVTFYKFVDLPDFVTLREPYRRWCTDHSIKGTILLALEGINAVVVGIMVAGTFYMMKDISITELKTVSVVNIAVILGTWLILTFTKLPSPLIVFVCLLLGWQFGA